MTTGQQTLPLRDIHLPEPVSWWPPAPGWWILLGLVMLLAWTIRYFWRRRMLKRSSIKTLALRELHHARAEFRRQGDAHVLVRELSRLLRQVCISLNPRQESASLTGKAWLAYLDRRLGDQRFLKGPGRLLIDAPYQGRADIIVDDLLALCDDWINVLPEQTGR